MPVTGWNWQDCKWWNFVSHFFKLFLFLSILIQNGITIVYQILGGAPSKSATEMCLRMTIKRHYQNYKEVDSIQIMHIREVVSKNYSPGGNFIKVWNTRGWKPSVFWIFIKLPRVDNLLTTDRLMCIISSVESQKGSINIQRCSVENQKGVIVVQYLWR